MPRLPRFGISTNGLRPGPLGAAEQVHQPPLGVAVGRLDLDHVGTEVGQGRSGGRDERPRRDLEHPDAVEGSGHVRLRPAGS